MAGKTKSPCAVGLIALLSAALALPFDLYAGPGTTPQRAGQVDRLIPAVSIDRNTKIITASPKSVVDWEDLLNTQVNGRARVALDDGSVLNVGSESSLRVVKHDAGAQQTQLELTYGKLRSEAQKITKPDGNFEVHTPAGVAGVVGTKFYTDYDNTTQTMTVLVYEGVVRVCNLQGVCVLVKAGQMSDVRRGDNSAPTGPVQAALDVLMAGVQSTEVGGAPGAEPVQTVSHVGKGTIITVGILGALVPAVVVPIVTQRGGSAAPASPTNGCKLSSAC